MGLGVIGVGAIAYYLYMKSKNKKGAMTTPPIVKSFSGDDDDFFNLTSTSRKPKPAPKWVAGGYVVNSEHPQGATWMALSTDGSLGYWANGYVPKGTISSTFGQ